MMLRTTILDPMGDGQIAPKQAHSGLRFNARFALTAAVKAISISSAAAAAL
jgi:hypothetical protein